jgi:arylformamidase
LRIHDVSLGISEGIVSWPGDPSVTIERVSSLEAGDSANVSRLTLGTHTGTHVDAPAHLFPGTRTLDSLPLEALVGQARVAHLVGATDITAADLEALDLPQDCRRLLLRTQNSDTGLAREPVLRRDYVALTPDAARWLVQRHLLLVGLDVLSVDAYAEGAGPVHRALLRAGIIIVEGLELSQVAPGDYELVCLPLKVVGGDGAPARAILIDHTA